MAQMIQSLSSGWQFKSATDSAWLPARVPSEVHTELLRHGRIPNPFVDLNELDVAWVAKQTWLYRTEFATPPEFALDSNLAVDLVFEGLDTFATVTLNGQTILQSDNSFIEHRVNINKFLTKTTANTLEIVFDPARKRGLELVKTHPEHDFIVHQTEVSRGPVRKAQYHWGWDWGPILLTCGPWKPVRLETYTRRVQNVRVDYEVELGGDEPVVTAQIRAEILGREQCHIRGEILFGEEVIHVFDSPAEINETWEYKSDKFTVPDAKLWWPRGYGPQPLYQFRVQCLDTSGLTLAEEAHTIGFRKVELIQDKDALGQSFYFRINGVDIFAGGSCWIPADSFVSRIDAQRYRDWMEVAAQGNQNMIRVWGGGIYEADMFYTACDELGILVWQDFMFACASYPTYPEYLSSIEAEARCNIQRIRHHPSVIIWCGNNEDYQLVERYHLQYDFSDKNPDSWLRSNFPARYIYEHVLPRLVSEVSSGSVYHPSSPWGNGTSTTLKVDPSVGDIHQWNVWHGDTRLYQNLPRMGGRFVSEFGMEAYPHLSTLRQFITSPSEQYPGSMTVDFHNKAVGYERRLLTYMGENFRLPTTLDGFAHTSQVMQSDAITWAYKSWRRDWGSPRARGCGGVLAWQLNDCWPTISWAVVDYFLVKKPAYYAIRRALRPLAVAVSRAVHDWTTRPADHLWRRDTGHVDPTRGVTEVVFDVWVASSLVTTVKGKVVVRAISVHTGEQVGESIEREVDMQSNGTTEILAGHKLTSNEPLGQVGPVVIHASLWVDEEQVSADVSWPEPIKYLDFSDRGVQVTPMNGGLVEVSCRKPVKGFVFSERQGVEVSDNGFDLVPGEIITVRITGAEGESLPWTFIGC